MSATAEVKIVKARSKRAAKADPLAALDAEVKPVKARGKRGKLTPPVTTVEDEFDAAMKDVSARMTAAEEAQARKAENVAGGAKLIGDAINKALAPAFAPRRGRKPRAAKVEGAKSIPKRGPLTHEDVAPRAARINPVTHCVVCGRYLKLHLAGLYAIELDGKTFHVGPNCSKRIPGAHLVPSFPKGWEAHEDIVNAADASKAAAIAFTILPATTAAPEPAPAPTPAAPVKAPVRGLSKAEQAKRGKGKGKRAAKA